MVSTTAASAASKMPLLVLLPAMQRDALAGFVDPNEGEAELRLARISLAVQGDQRPPDEPGQARADQGVERGHTRPCNREWRCRSPPPGM